MSQFLGGAIFLTIAAGLALHAGVEWPWFLDWIGRLPGDMIIKKEHITLYLPLTSSLLISGVLSILLSFFSRR